MDTIPVLNFKSETDVLTEKVNALTGQLDEYNFVTLLIIISAIVFILLISLTLIIILKKQNTRLQNEIQAGLARFKKELDSEKARDRTSEGQNNRLLIPIFDGHEYLDLDQVVRIKADGRYSIIHFSNSKSLVVSRNIGEFERGEGRHCYWNTPVDPERCHIQRYRADSHR